MKIEISGQWRGEYRYGDAYPTGLPPVQFSMDLNRRWFGRFRGTVRDDPTTGMPELGIIRGSVRGTRITFVKVMPVGYCFTEDGEMTTCRSYLSAQHNADPGEIPHRPLKYSGIYDLGSNTFRGEWRIAADDWAGAGTWWMSRRR